MTPERLKELRSITHVYTSEDTKELLDTIESQQREIERLKAEIRQKQELIQILENHAE